MKKTLRILAVVYFILSLPLVLVYVGNAYFRFEFMQVLAHWQSKLSNIKYVFIGDSLTSGGRNWGDKIGVIGWNTLNLAENMYLTRQVSVVAEKAVTYHPKYCFVLAGTNDAFLIQKGEKTLDDFSMDYTILIDKLCTGKVKPVITLVPYQSKTKISPVIDSINYRITSIASERGIPVVNINDIVSKGKQLLPEYTTDGVHLTDKAYDVWGEKLKAVIE